MIPTRSTLYAVVLTLLPASPLLADRMPSPDERARIESTLRAAGFTSWGEIESEDGGRWEVEDAVGPDGRRYELKLDDTFAIIRREPD
ncbi:PepSY domain-containing protein [Rhodoplanes azumiensis]|uniref:PepSY domain-containing protein n=1 Tax=Rhodoplanes azumiensis TaxID=1897628 RepID=A0ABW5AHU9_9BRAD